MRTQKAKGIMLGVPYIMSKYPEISRFFAPISHKLISSKYHLIEDNFNRSDFPCFARPCPVTPRHGFIESKPVYSIYQLIDMWSNARTIEEGAEIIIGPHMRLVKCSSVYVCSGLLSIGKDHDGATGGKNSIEFPVAPTTINKKIKRDSGIKDDSDVYLESIFSNNRWHLVQVRGGPTTPMFEDYVPSDITVKKVIEPIDNLLRWESITKNLAKGTVVYGKGYSLASHAAIHCILNNIPFITSRRPKKGEEIKKNKRKNVKLSKKLFMQGFYVADKYVSNKITAGFDTKKEMERMLFISVSILHNWAYIAQSSKAAWLFGVSSAFLARISSSLCFGEFRHSDNSPNILNVFDDNDRAPVYRGAMTCDISYMKNLYNICKDFYKNPDWNEGYGGVLWATCSWYSLKLWKYISNAHNTCSANLSKRSVQNIMGTMNKLINLSHNNGWWFNKCSDIKLFDFAAKLPGLAILCVANDIYDLHKRTTSDHYKCFSNFKLPNLPTGIDNEEMFWINIKPHGHQDHLYIFKHYASGKCLARKINIDFDTTKKIFEKSCNNGFYPQGEKYMVFRVHNNRYVKLPNRNILDINKIFKKRQKV